MFKFVDCHDSILTGTSQAVNPEKIHQLEMQQFFDGMIAFAKGEQSVKHKHILVGLAAPQIGYPIRVILVDVKADGKGGVSELCLYINPEILKFSEEEEEWYEGCFSTGMVKGIVKRPNRVQIRAYNREGREINETHVGYVARIFQHEIDHLNGIRFPERISSRDCIHIVKPEEMHAYRNQQGWRNWPHTSPQIDWRNCM